MLRKYKKAVFCAVGGIVLAAGIAAGALTLKGHKFVVGNLGMPKNVPAVSSVSSAPVSEPVFGEAETIFYENGYVNMSLDIPEGWTYEICTESGYPMDLSTHLGIRFRPEDSKEGSISLVYKGSSWGVCGTGLSCRETQLGGYAASQCTYDDAPVWSFISLMKTGDYVVLNEGADIWWDEHGSEAMQILSTLRIAEGIIPRTEALRIAAESSGQSPDGARADFDHKTGIWTVTFPDGTSYSCQGSGQGSAPNPAGAPPLDPAAFEKAGETSDAPSAG